MKILHVFKDYFPPSRGGVEHHISDVVHSLDDFEFAVLTSSRTKKTVIEDDNGVRVVRSAELARPTSTPITPGWPKFLRLAGADLIHFHMPNPFGELAFLASRTSIPMVATYHADIVGRKTLLPLFAPFQKRFLSRARRIVVSNPNLRDTSSALAGFQERCLVIPFGVDIARFERRPSFSDGIRARFQTPIIVFLGRVAYYKGLDVLIHAMRYVRATCLIVGEGPRRVALESQSRTWGVEEKVLFLGEGSEEDKLAYLHSADLFVLPSTSRAEAFGISMLEAMACGVPAVSTELGTGTSWVNKHRATGLVVPPGDVQALAGAINTLLQDDDWRRRLGAAAARHARERFTKAQMLEDLSALYVSEGSAG